MMTLRSSLSLWRSSKSWKDENETLCAGDLQFTGNTLEGDVSDVIALDQLTSPFSPRKATKMSP